MCSILYDRLIKEAYDSQGLSHIDNAENDSGSKAYNDHEVLWSETDESGLFQKRKYKVRYKVCL